MCSVIGFILCRCFQCDQLLCNAPTCHIYNGSIYCKPDYIRITTCSGCSGPIAHADWVRRAGAYVYHLACFACDMCKRQLSTGETFSLDQMSNDHVRLLCKTHFQTEGMSLQIDFFLVTFLKCFCFF